MVTRNPPWWKEWIKPPPIIYAMSVLITAGGVYVGSITTDVTKQGDQLQSIEIRLARIETQLEYIRRGNDGR